MLAIVSDLHLNDKTTGTPLEPGAFQIFGERLQELAIRASWRADGRYRPIDRLDLVLLGDILDLIRTTQWLRADVRPWDDVSSPRVADVTASIVDGILQQNRETCEMIRSLSAEGSIRIPPGTQTGEPVYGAEEVPVAVRAFYMVGNHDWLLHLPGPRYDMIRQKIAHQLGLANLHNAPFPHDPLESEELLSALRKHRVMARHGDIFDPINFCEDRDASSLGDAIVIELLTRFSVNLEERLGEELPRNVLLGLRELDHIRPLLLAPVWIEGLLERNGVRPVVRKEIKRMWDSLADQFLQLPFVREQDSRSPFDLVDGLEQTLKFSKRLSIGWAAKIIHWVQGLRGGDSYAAHALVEQDFRNRRARHIVYGHTHQAESVPLDASFADGYVLNQMYFNAGTWRRVLRQTQSNASECEFIPAENISLLSFFHGDERSGRVFESWTGTLAAVGDTAVHRVDTGRVQHAPEQPISTSRVPVRPPHFRPAPAPTRVAQRQAY